MVVVVRAVRRGVGVCVGGEGAHVGGCGVAGAHGNVVGWWGSSRRSVWVRDRRLGP